MHNDKVNTDAIRTLMAEVDLRALDLKTWVYRMIADQRGVSAQRAKITIDDDGFRTLPIPAGTFEPTRASSSK